MCSFWKICHFSFSLYLSICSSAAVKDVTKYIYSSSVLKYILRYFTRVFPHPATSYFHCIYLNTVVTNYFTDYIFIWLYFLIGQMITVMWWSADSVYTHVIYGSVTSLISDTLRLLLFSWFLLLLQTWTPYLYFYSIYIYIIYVYL